MSVVRKHFCTSATLGAGGSSRPRKQGLNGCIPAVVSSTEGSCTDGTSDAEDTILCPRSSKKDRYVRPVSSTLTRRSLRSCDHAVADDEVAVEQAGDLPRRRPVHGLVQGDHRLAR